MNNTHISYFVSFLMLLLMGCGDAHKPASTSDINKDSIYIAAHRGGYENEYNDRAPENSLANIQNAIDHGFPIYESDVQRTSDGIFIIMHDATIDRTTNGSGVVAEMSGEEIQEYHLIYRTGEDSNEKIPILDEFISKGNGKIIFKIDYKPELKYLGELIAQINDLKLQNRVILRFRYKKEIVEALERLNSDDRPQILFRVTTLSQFEELKSTFNPKMISIFTGSNNAFSEEQLQIIELASEENIIIEAHAFHDNNADREKYWAEQLKLPITIFHTRKPILFQEFLKKQQNPIEWFQDARFGIFIHYDPSSVYGDIYENAGIEIGQKRFSQDKYADIYKQFNPVNFNAEEWVGIFKKSGARYVAFTTKHSYGLHMWDNPLFDKDIMATPFKRDICKELSDALHKQDIKLFWYYNAYDRLYPNFFEEMKDSLSAYYPFRQSSIEQLLTNYGDVTGIWWDGSPTYHNKELVTYVKSIRPDILMTGRLGIKGDYDTPEQIIGAFEIENPWESCYAIEGINWMWAGGEDVKDIPTCIKTLVNCAVGGGNLLLNISPMPNGNIQPEQVTSLLGIGDWLEKYGESIYGTRGGPYKPGTWGGSTRKGNKVYLHIMQQIEGGKLELPNLPSKINGYKLLTEGSVSIEQNEKIIISLDAKASHPEVCTVLEIELEQSAMDISPIITGFGEKSITADAMVTASSQEFPNTSPEAVIYHSDLEDITRDYRVLIRSRNRNLPIPERLQNLPEWGFTPRERGFRLRYWRNLIASGHLNCNISKRGNGLPSIKGTK